MRKKILLIVCWICVVLLVVVCTNVSSANNLNKQTENTTITESTTMPTVNNTIDNTETKEDVDDEVEIEETHGHLYIEQKVEATCTSQGYVIYSCDCGDVFVDNYTTEKPHNYLSKIVLPSCEKDGYTQYQCQNCGYTYTADSVLALGHNYTSIVTEPTCEEKGYTTNTCKNCEHTYVSNEINALGHCYKTETVAPTVDTQGYDKHSCLHCKKSYQDNYVNKLTYPLTYSDETCTITIYREWFENAWIYAAHLEFTNYSRFGTACANGQYNNGYETTSHAAKRLNAIFAVNGCYSAKWLNYPVVRSGIVCNDQICVAPGTYNSATGIFASSGSLGLNNIKASIAVEQGLITDTFRFGDACLSNGKVIDFGNTSQAQRTFIGTNGKAGDIWICVSDGRYNDGKSAGLTYGQCGKYLQSKGCIYGIPLDGGGSSTMYFNGQVLNAARGNERAVIDFVYFK
jgi:hypothetical protein